MPDDHITHNCRHLCRCAVAISIYGIRRRRSRERGGVRGTFAGGCTAATQLRRRRGVHSWRVRCRQSRSVRAQAGMYNFDGSGARLWRSTTPQPSRRCGSELSLRRPRHAAAAATMAASAVDLMSDGATRLPLERAVDVPVNFVAKPRRGATSVAEPPPSEKCKKKRKLPRLLKIRFTRKKRSAEVEWPTEPLPLPPESECDAVFAESVAGWDSRGPGARGLILLPALAGYWPRHSVSPTGDDLTISSGLGSSWETGLSGGSSTLASLRQPSLRRSVRRFRRTASLPGRQRAASCPCLITSHHVATEEQHTQTDASHTADPPPLLEPVPHTDPNPAELGTQHMEHTASDVVIAEAEHSASGTDAINTESDLFESSANRTGPEPISLCRTRQITVSGESGDAVPVECPTSAQTAVPPPPPSPPKQPATNSVQRTFSRQLEHQRPLVTGVEHYWRVRRQHERDGTLHVHQASVPFNQLPRNVQPFVLYHRPVVEAIQEYWQQRRRALRRLATACPPTVTESTQPDQPGTVSEEPARDEAAPGDAEVIPPQTEQQSAAPDSDATAVAEEMVRQDRVTTQLPGELPEKKASVDLGDLGPLTDFTYTLPHINRSRPAPPRRARRLHEPVEQSECIAASTEPPVHPARRPPLTESPVTEAPPPVAASRPETATLQLNLPTPPVLRLTQSVPPTPASPVSPEQCGRLAPFPHASRQAAVTAVVGRSASTIGDQDRTGSGRVLSRWKSVAVVPAVPVAPLPRSPPRPEVLPGTNFASNKNFWQSLQDLSSVADDEKSRARNRERTQITKNPVSVFFKQLIRKTESVQSISSQYDNSEQQHTILHVKSRIKPSHSITETLPNMAVPKVKHNRFFHRHNKVKDSTAQSATFEEPRQKEQVKVTTSDPGQPGEAASSPAPAAADSSRSSVQKLRQLLSSRPVQPVAPYQLQRASPATASCRRFIRPGVVRQLQAQFENMARQH